MREPRSRPERAAETPTPATDLVGWATRTRLGDRPQSPARRRAVLAAALGVAAERLGQLDDDEVRVALARLTSIVDQCRRLAAEVTVDELTGALRRGAGMDALQREIDRARRVSSKGLTVLFVDVDGLKTVNDTQGHAAGDALLRNVVAAIRERLRSYDLVVRYGGDEFVCVLADSALEDAEHTVADIVSSVAQRLPGRSVSVGLAHLEAGESATDLVGRADIDLYSRRRAVRTVKR